MMRSVSAVILLLALSTTARAQETVVLPDLAPREVEITGELTISFPSLDRQPLVGFNPPPRVPEIPVSRTPFTEAYKQSKDELPNSSLTAPEAPIMSAVSDRASSLGFVEGGGGRYFERFIRGRLAAPVGSRATLLVAGQYDATDGYEPFSDNPDVKSESKVEFVSAGLRQEWDRVRLGADVRLQRSEYALFGAVPVAGSPAIAEPVRKWEGWQTAAWIGTTPGNGFGGRIGVDAEHTSIETNLLNASIENSTIDRDEDHLLVEGNMAIPAGVIGLDVEGHAMFQGLDADGFPGRTVTSGSAAGLIRLRGNDFVSIEAGVRWLGFEALGQAAGGADRSIQYLAPDFSVDYEIAPGAHIVISNRPEVSRESARERYRFNPYVEDLAAVQPNLLPVNFTSSIQLTGEVFQVRTGIGWQDFANYRFVENAVVPVHGFGQGFFAVGYEEASVFYVDAMLGAVIAPGVQAGLEFAFRRGQLDESDTTIPYFSPVVATATLVASLFADRLSLKALASSESSRYVDRSESIELDPVLLFDLEGTYYLTPQAGIILGIGDLGSSAEFWENYAAETSVFYGGVRFRW